MSPFGAERGGAVGTWPTDRGFLDKTTDKTTGLTHIGAREYDPMIGQFISVDPALVVDQHQSLNGYAYANNTPVTSSDSTGLWLDDGWGHAEPGGPLGGHQGSGKVGTPPGGVGPGGCYYTCGTGTPSASGSGGKAGSGGTEASGKVTTSDIGVLNKGLTDQQLKQMRAQGYKGSKDFTLEEAAAWMDQPEYAYAAYLDTCLLLGGELTQCMQSSVDNGIRSKASPADRAIASTLVYVGIAVLVGLCPESGVTCAGAVGMAASSSSYVVGSAGTEDWDTTYFVLTTVAGGLGNAGGLRWRLVRLRPWLPQAPLRSHRLLPAR